MKIPSADGFGSVVAAPGPRVQRTAPSTGEAIGRAVSGVALDVVRDQRLEERRAAAEAKATADAADRSKAVRAVQSARDSLAVAHDEIAEQVASGVIPKAEAADRWSQRFNEIRSSSLEGISEKYLPDTQADIDSQNVRFTRGINKAVLARDQSEVRSGLTSTLEQAQRLYQQDPDKARLMVDSAFQVFGPASGLAPDALTKMHQGWRENTTYTAAYTKVNEARASNQALAKVEKELGDAEFADMDPQRKAQLLTTLEGYRTGNIQRAEAAARRAEAERERRLREGQAAFESANSLIQTGKMLSPEYVEQLTRTTAGTPFAAALPDLLRQAPERAAFGQQPLTVMKREIDQTRAGLNARGTDPAAEKLLAQREAIHEQAVKDYAADPLRAAQERGILTQVAPLDTSSVNGLLTSLAGRRDQAALVQQQAGQPVSPFLKEEAEGLGRLINTLPPAQRSSAVAQLAEALGPQQAAAVSRQLAPNNQPLGLAFGLAGARTVSGRYSSELVLLGAQAMNDKTIKEDNAAMTGTRASVAAEIGDAYPNEEMRQNAIDAAVFIRYGLQAEGRPGAVTKAVELATGGIAEHNGRKLPMPYGVNKDDFDKKLTALTPASVRTPLPDGKVYVSGVAMDAATFLKQVPSASLIHAGQGRYSVQTGGGLATNAAGKQLIFEVK